MKYIILTMVLCICACSSEPELKKEVTSDNSEKMKPYLLKYVHAEYVRPAEKELFKLERQKSFIEEKFRIAKPENQKTVVVAKLSEIKDRIESLKLWPLYYEALNVKDRSEKKDVLADRMIYKIKQRYKELNGHDFPDVEQEFMDKYGQKLNADIQ